MRHKIIDSYRLADGTKVTIRRFDEHGLTVFRHYIKGRYAFGTLSEPLNRENITRLYFYGYFNKILEKRATV